MNVAFLFLYILLKLQLHDRWFNNFTCFGINVTMKHDLGDRATCVVARAMFYVTLSVKRVPRANLLKCEHRIS